MTLTLALGLFMAAQRCENRSVTITPPPGSAFSRLGGPVLAGASACPEGEVPASPAAPASPDLPPRPDRREDERDCAPQGCWAWAGWNDRRPMRGAGARLSIERPAATTPDHSLAEVALAWGRADHEIVEIGWEVAPRRHGDTAPHLFVHRWVKGTTCPAPCGFQRWGRRLWPGMSLAPWTGRDLAVGWLLWEGRAWAWADGEWLGSYPLDPPEASRVASLAQWFGEVFFVHPPPRVPMGNGLRAEEPGAARVTAVCDVLEERAECVVRPERLPRVTEPDIYSLSTDADGGFRYGGPARLRPPPPPSSASGGTPAPTGTSAPSRPR